MTWQVGLSSSAIRDLERLPRRVAPAVIEFLYGPLAGNPHRVGKALRDDVQGLWSARRGDYRVLYLVDPDNQRVLVTRIDHRARVYRSR